MTTPPPSETGPSAEASWRDSLPSEVVKAALDLAAMLGLHIPPDFPPSEIARRLSIPLVGLFTEAKRSAHLEDARAGCKWCKNADPVYTAQWGLHWWHGSRSCERPEVWDALSLPPGGQK